MKRFRYLSAIGALALVVAACGSDDPAADSTPPPTDAATTDAATTTDAPTTTPISEVTTTDGSDPSDPAWDAVVEAANEEGKVVLYTTHLPNQQEALEAAFEAKYPEIDLQQQRLIEEFEPTIQSERETGADGGDVGIFPAPTIAAGLLADGDLLPIEGPQSASWKGNETFVDDSYFTANYNAQGIAWNTDEVKEPITGYADLLRPELKGRIGIPGVSHPIFIEWWAFIQQEYGGDQFLGELAAQEASVYPSTVPMDQALASGEIAVHPFAVASVLDLKEQGAPIEFTVPQPAWGSPFIAFGLGWSHRPNAARVLLDFIQSPEGQTALAINGGSALEGIPGLTTIDKIVPSQIGQRQPSFYEEFAAKWNETYGR